MSDDRTIGNVRADMAVRRLTRAVLWLAAVTCVCLVVAAYALHENRATNDERDRARAASCVQVNVQIAATRVAVASGLDAVVSLTTDVPHDLRADALAEYRARVARNLPYRDCSPEGLAAYFHEAPADPAVSR